MRGLFSEAQKFVVGMTGDSTCDCKHCICSSGFHEDDGECAYCLDDGLICPGYEAMEADPDE